MHTEDILRIRDNESRAEKLAQENKTQVLLKHAQQLLKDVARFNNEHSIHKLERIIKFITQTK
jgi:hypothetical protein